MTLSPKVWGDVMRRLQDEIPDFAFDAWIAPLAVKIVHTSAHESLKPELNLHLVLGCPTSFHRDRIRTNYVSLIRDCWQAACCTSEIDVQSTSAEANGTSGSDGVGEATIELLTMKDFASAAGSRIEVRIPTRIEVSAKAGMRKVATGAISPEVIQIQGGGSIRPTLNNAHARQITTSTDFSDVASPKADAPSHLHAVPEQGRRKRAAGASRRVSGAAVSAVDPSSIGGPSGSTRSQNSLSDRTRRTARSRVDNDLSLNPNQPELPFSFESFIVGPCNSLAREAALALARRRQLSLNQLYLAGGSGMGKTHLARAAAAEARRHSQGIYNADAAHPLGGAYRPGPGPGRFAPSARREQVPKVVYTSAEQFTSDFVSAMRLGRPEDWKKRYRGSIGLLVVEDVQFFSGREKTQFELFHTIQHVLDAGGSVLLTGDRPPRDLVGLDERIRTQVGRGFVAELEMPDAIVRRHILRSKASAGGVRLPEDCLDLLVESAAGSVRDIESMLIQVVTTSSLLGRTIDLELIHEAIAIKTGTTTTLAPKTLDPSEIVRLVAAFFGKPAAALAGRSRRRDVLIPRQLAMYLSHRYTNASYAQIGRSLGRDHPSVRNAIGRIERLVLENAPLRYKVEALSERIDQMINEKTK